MNTHRKEKIATWLRRGRRTLMAAAALMLAAAVGAPQAQPPDGAGQNAGRPEGNRPGLPFPERPMPPVTISRWLQLDGVLRRNAEAARTANKEIDAVFQKIEDERKGYEPGQLTPAAVAANDRLRQLFKDQHELRARRRMAMNELLRAADDLDSQRESWKKILPQVGEWLGAKEGKAAAAAERPADLAVRFALWKKSFEENTGDATLESLLGVELARMLEIARRMLRGDGFDRNGPGGPLENGFGENSPGGNGPRDGFKGPRHGDKDGLGDGPNEGRGEGRGEGSYAGMDDLFPGPPGMGNFAPQIRERWERRLDRLGERRAELTHELEQQDREIEKLRRMIDWANLMQMMNESAGAPVEGGADAGL